MPQIDLSINGKTYPIVCDKGQEAHLRELAGVVNQRMRELVNLVDHGNEQRLLVLTLLSMADELQQTQHGLRQAEEARDQHGQQAQLAEAVTAGKLEDFANRIEQVAARLEDT